MDIKKDGVKGVWKWLYRIPRVKQQNCKNRRLVIRRQKVFKINGTKDGDDGMALWCFLTSTRSWYYVPTFRDSIVKSTWNNDLEETKYFLQNIKPFLKTRLTRDLQEGKIWYVPHHGVNHQNKFEKKKSGVWSQRPIPGEINQWGARVRNVFN